MNHVSNHTNTPSEHSKQRGTAKASVSTNPASSVQRPASSKAATRPAKTATRLSAAKNTATARHHKNTRHPTNPNKERPLYAPNTPLVFLFPRRLSGAFLTPTPHYWGGFSGQKKAKNQKTCAKFWNWCHRKVQRKLIWTSRKIQSKSIFSYIYGRRKNISYVLKLLAIQIQIYKLYILK